LLLIIFDILCLTKKFKKYFIMESACDDCRINGYLYKFSVDRKRRNFMQARAACMEKGGDLANNLESNTYRNFNKCCSSNSQYIIGLSDQDMCKNSGSGKYMWVGSDTCTNANPLMLIDQANNNGCQAVAITLQTNNALELPTASLIDCLTKNRFICQIPVLTTTITNPTPSTSTSFSSGSAPNMTQTIYDTQIPSTANPIRVTGGPTTINSPALIASLVIGGIVFLLLVVLMSILRKRHWKRRRTSDCDNYPVMSAQESNGTKEFQDNILYNGYVL